MGNASSTFSPEQELWQACGSASPAAALALLRGSLPADPTARANLLNYEHQQLTPLLQASLAGHVALAQQLLLLGASPFCLRPSDGAGPLLLAAQRGHAALVSHYLGLPWGPQAAVQRDTLDRSTPLHWAALNGHAEVVKLLVDGLSPPSIQNSIESSSSNAIPSSSSSSSSSSNANSNSNSNSMVNVGSEQRLPPPSPLRSGPAAERSVGDAAPPLSVVAHPELEKSTDLLSSHLVDSVSPMLSFPETPNPNPPPLNPASNPLPSHPSSSSSSSAVDSDASSSPLSLPAPTPIIITPPTPSHPSSSPSSSSASAAPHFAGADPNEIGSVLSGATPLFIAAQKGHLAVVEALLDRGADAEFHWRSGATPLFIAAQNGHAAVVELLLARGALPDAPRLDMATPLVAAAFQGHAAPLALLLAAGADPQRRIRDGSTALFMAAGLGFEKVAELLLAAGADDLVQLRDGATAHVAAHRNGHTRVVQLLHCHRLSLPESESENAATLLPAEALATMPKGLARGDRACAQLLERRQGYQALIAWLAHAIGRAVAPCTCRWHHAHDPAMAKSYPMPPHVAAALAAASNSSFASASAPFSSSISTASSTASAALSACEQGPPVLPPPPLFPCAWPACRQSQCSRPDICVRCSGLNQ